MILLKNACYRCGGSGLIQDLTVKWWQFWKVMVCPICNGDGLTKRPAVKPTPPPPPPPYRTREDYRPLPPDSRPVGPPPPPPPVPLKDRIKIELSSPLTEEQEMALIAFIKAEVKKAIYECISELKAEYGEEKE